jgi:hypothetical protein
MEARAATEPQPGSSRGSNAELANEELLKAHFRALWLAATRQRLPGKVKELVDLGAEGRPLVADLREALASDDACRSAQADGQAIVDDLVENHWLGSSPPTWLTGSWLDALIRGAALDFDAAPDKAQSPVEDHYVVPDYTY